MTIPHTELLDLVAQAIQDVFPERAGQEIAPDHCLDVDYGLSGTRIIWLFERLELTLSLRLHPSIIIDYVLAGPSVGRLARTMAAQLHEQFAAEVHHDGA